MAHTLVVYGASERADAVLRAVAEAARADGGRLTVLSLVVQEPEQKGCCDTRSVMWNGVLREMVGEDLGRARLAVEDHPAAEFDAVAFSGRGAADVVVREAIARHADAIVLADSRADRVGALQRRRLRRHSPVPVSEGVPEPAQVR
jgi:nucleotide-binding universal stress UspA family protein